MKTFIFSQYSLLCRSFIVRSNFRNSQVVNLLYLGRNLSVKRIIMLLLLMTILSIFYYISHLNTPLHGWVNFMISVPKLFGKCLNLLAFFYSDSWWEEEHIWLLRYNVRILIDDQNFTLLNTITDRLVDYVLILKFWCWLKRRIRNWVEK